MAVELIALDRWSESDRPIFYGAVTTGDIWQFGSFDRQNAWDNPRFNVISIAN